MKKTIGILSLALISLGAAAVPAMARERNDNGVRNERQAYTTTYRRNDNRDGGRDRVRNDRARRDVHYTYAYDQAYGCVR